MDTDSPAPLETATVLRVDRRGAMVDLPDGTVLEAVVRGRLHHAERRETGPVAVGDRVRIERTEDGRAAIVSVEPRRGVLLRPEVAGRWRRQVLVANADLAVLVFAHRDPVPASGLLDRLLVACHAGEVPVVLVFNKSDLEPAPETETLLRLYEALGFTFLRTSAERQEGISELQAILKDRCAVFAGPSGAGKSSLVNRALPGVRLRTGEISSSTGKGRHTTTAAQLVRVPGAGGHVIDTPGIREFGVVTIPPEDVALHFPEFPDPGSCRFDDCRHLSEPGCAVLEAVRAGQVAPSRHASYRVLREELEQDDRRDRGEGGSRRSGRPRGRDGNAACTRGARG